MRFQSPLLLSCSLLALSPLILALPSPQQPGDYDAALRKAAADPPAQLGEYLKNATQTYVSMLGNSWASTVNVASPEYVMGEVRAQGEMKGRGILTLILLFCCP